jgi:hypothetical protein
LAGISGTNFKLENLKKDQVIDEDFIADVRNKFKIAFFLYKRKKSRWIALYKEIKDLTNEVGEIPENY